MSLKLLKSATIFTLMFYLFTILSMHRTFFLNTQSLTFTAFTLNCCRYIYNNKRFFSLGISVCQNRCFFKSVHLVVHPVERQIQMGPSMLLSTQRAFILSCSRHIYYSQELLYLSLILFLLVFLPLKKDIATDGA